MKTRNVIARGCTILLTLGGVLALTGMARPESSDFDAALDRMIAGGDGVDRVGSAITMLSASSLEARREALQALPGQDVFGDVATAYADWLDAHARTLDQALWADAALAAMQLNLARSAPHLADWLVPAADDAYTREVILYALGGLGVPDVTGAIQPLTTHPEEWTRFLAVEALARIGGTWRDDVPVWAGAAARGLMVACRTTAAEEHLYWKELAERDFGGRLMFVTLAWLKPGVMGGWQPGRPGPGGRATSDPAVQQFDFDDDGRPQYAVCLLIELNIAEVDAFFLWRMFNYVRRGGRAAIVGNAIFQRAIQRELLGTTVLGGGIYGRTLRTLQWPRGPWDAIVPQAQERMPAFPNVDGLTPTAKRFHYGYNAVGQGGLLLMVTEPVRHLDLVGIEGGVPKDLKTGVRRGDASPDYGPVWPALARQLVWGPEAYTATLDWVDEPDVLPSPRAGQTLDLDLAVRSRAIEGSGAVVARLACPVRGVEIAALRAPAALVPGRRVLAPLLLAIDPLAEPGAYALDLALEHRGVVQHAISRPIDVKGRYDLAIEAFAYVPTTPLRSAVRFRVTDHGGEPLRDGLLTMELRDEDRDRVMARWAQTWDGPTGAVSFVDLPVTVPAGLPRGQYALTAHVGDIHGRVFGQARAETAASGFFDFDRDVLWSVWGRTQQVDGNPVFQSMRINTAFGWGGFRRPPGFPYQYGVFNPPFVATGQWLGDIYLGNDAAAGQRASWERLAQATATNARAVAINLIEEVGYDPQAAGLPLQRDLYYQTHYRTVERLNREAAVDIQAWDQLDLARATPGHTLLGGGHFHYDFRDTLLNMRTYWFREHNPHVNLQPGMGAGLRSPWYDSMHMRTYLRRDTLTATTQYRTAALPAYGRTPFTWLLNMYHNTNVADQARVVWSAIAAGGRHLCNYAPGDRYGAELQRTDGSLTPSGETYARVMASVNPCEPVLCHTQNRISDEVMVYDNHPWGYGGWDGVLDTLFRLGIQPGMSDDGAACRIMFFSNGNFRDPAGEIAALHRAVEDGLVLVIGPGGNPALARSFGIRIPDPKAAHIPPGGIEWAEDPEETPDFLNTEAADAGKPATRLRFGALSVVLEGVADLTLEASPGPAAGVAEDSPLTYAGSVAYGALGKGLVVYVNAHARLDRERSAPVEFEGWARLYGALLARAGVVSPFLILDARNAIDPWFVGYLLDTDDRGQDYLLVQLNSTVPAAALCDGARTARVLVRDPSIRRVHDIRAAQSADVRIEGDRRFFDITLEPGLGTLISLIREEPGGLVAHALSREAVAGQPLPVAVSYRGPDGQPSVSAHTIVIEAATSDGTPIPNLFAKGLLSGGHTVLHPWIADSDPRGEVTLRVHDVTTGERAGVPIRIVDPRQAADAPVWRLDGPVLLGGQIRGSIRAAGASEAVVHAQDFAIETDVPWVSVAVEPAAGDGTRPFTVAVATDAPAGEALLRGVSGADARGAGGLILKIPPPFTLDVDPLPDLRVPDIVAVELTGRLHNHTRHDRGTRMVTAFPAPAAFLGEASTRVAAGAAQATEFRIPFLLSRQVGRAAHRPNLTMSVRAVDDAGSTLAEAQPRFLVNPWDVAPPVISSLDGGVARLSLSNATASAVTIEIRFATSDGFTVLPATRSVTVPAGQSAVSEFAIKDASVPRSDGIYALPYTVGIGAGQPVEGQVVIERRTISRWWMGTRSMIRLGDRLDIGNAGPSSPWAFDRTLYRVAQAPAGHRLNSFSTALDLELTTPRPEHNMIVTMVTRITAERGRKITAELIRADGVGVTTIRSTDTDQARFGAGDQALRGMLWINGILLIDSRGAETDISDFWAIEQPQPAIDLQIGVNTLRLAYEVGLIPPSGSDRVAQLTTRLPRLFVRLRDAETGQLVNDLPYDVTTADPQNERW